MPKSERRLLIKEQNNAAKSGKYINLAEAKRRLNARLEQEAQMKLKGKKI